MAPATRKLARAQNSTRYFTGKPCVRGHVAERVTSRGLCVECLREAERLSEPRKRRRRARYEAGKRDPEKGKMKRENDKKYYEKNRERVVARAASYQRANLDRVRDNRLRRMGASLEQFKLYVESNDGRCPICLGRPESFVADHDHGTGLFRGAICSGCNSLLGYAKDDPSTLQRAILYIGAHHE